MAVDVNGPAFVKYLSRIPVSRLNKAPIITISKFPNADYNSISVRLADLAADEGAGNSLKAGISLQGEHAPDTSKWERYYRPESVNAAPMISMYGRGEAYSKHYLSVVPMEVPLRMDEAKKILGDVEPDRALYEKRYEGRLNMAPHVYVQYTEGKKGGVSVEMTNEPLNLPAAQYILNKYRA